MTFFSFLALSAGAAIAIQAMLNAQLGVLLKSSLIGTSIAFLFACLFTLAVMFVTTKHYPQTATTKAVPVYLWFSGGALSAFGVSIFYFLIPRMGVGSMMSYALSGQMLMAIIASHFGWFHQTIKPVDIKQITGLVFLISGILLINWEHGHAHSPG